jgi:hypothetical protein
LAKLAVSRSKTLSQTSGRADVSAANVHGVYASRSTGNGPNNGGGPNDSPLLPTPLPPPLLLLLLPLLLVLPLLSPKLGGLVDLAAPCVSA